MNLADIDPRHQLPARDLFCGEAADPVQDYEVNGFRIMRCRRCGLAWSDPHIAPAALFESVYTSDYGLEQARDPAQRPLPSRLWRAVRSKFAPTSGTAKRWHFVRRWLPADAQVSFLEVGCWRGNLLALIAREQPRWKLRGLEPSPFAVERARQAGLDVEQGFLEDGSLPADSFDGLCAWDVIEHTEDPAEFLRGARRVLRPGGRCILHCPNYASLRRRVKGARWNVLLPEQHRWHFTPATLARLLGEVEAEVIHLSGGPLSLGSRIYAVIHWPA